MLVTVKDAVAVGPTTSFGEIFTVVDNDDDPTNGTTATGQTDRGNMLITPGEPDSFGNIDTLGGDFNPERIQIDDDNGVLPGFVTPDVNVGRAARRCHRRRQLRLRQLPGGRDAGLYGRAGEHAREGDRQLTGDADHLLVASYNAENLDPKRDSPIAQRPAPIAMSTTIGTAFNTIAADPHTLNAPDIVALQEIQDNDGAGAQLRRPRRAVTLQTLVDAINAWRCAPALVHYAFIDNPFIADDANGGQPGGNIRTAFLYRDDRVDLVDGFAAHHRRRRRVDHAIPPATATSRAIPTIRSTTRGRRSSRPSSSTART